MRRVDTGQARTVHERVVVEVPEPEKLLTLQEAADAAGLTLHTLKGRVARGVVSAARIGRSVRVRLSDLD